MKMLKKLLAVVLTGAMALTLLTACGGNAVRDKDIADALNDIVKSSVAAGKHENYTFKPRTDEQAMAKAIAALSEAESEHKGMGTINCLGQSRRFLSSMRAAQMKQAALSGVEQFLPMRSEQPDRLIM